MIIVHFAEYASGGVATYLKDLICAQLKRSEVDKIYLIVSSTNSDKELIQMKSSKLKIIQYPYSRGIRGIFKLLSLSSLIRKINPDVVHIHSTFAGLIRIRFLFSSFKKRIVYCSHGWAFNREISSIKKSLIKLIEKILSFGCAKIINISKYEMKTSKFISKKKSVLIYNSIPEFVVPDVQINEQDTVSNLLFVGRLDKQKGIDILVKALNVFSNEKVFNLKVIGDSIVDPVVDKKNTSNIQFFGWKMKNVVRKEIIKADIVVIPSRWEGFGLVTLEAMNCGKMIISSDSGALPEIVKDNVNGLIFKSGSLESLLKTLKLVNKMSPEDIKNMGTNGKLKFEKEFDYNTMIDKIMNLYRKLSVFNEDYSDNTHL